MLQRGNNENEKQNIESAPIYEILIAYTDKVVIKHPLVLRVSSYGLESRRCR